MRSLLALLSSTTRIRPSPLIVFLGYQEAERAALAELAGELDAPAQEAGQSLADVKAQASTFSRRREVLLELLECLEQLSLIFELDADTGIDHVEPHRGPIIKGAFLDLKADLARVGELDRVVAQVDQD